MTSLIINILTFLLLTLSNQGYGQEMQLIASHVIFRHGDRTPVTTFPTDPMKENDWPNGYGQLTSRGIEQHHRLGMYLRNRYGSLLSANYTPYEIAVRSTDLDRTLMSAQSNLAGLYPVMNIIEDKVPIQPIPIHTVPANTDYLLGISACPRYDQIEDEVDQSEEVKKTDEDYKDFFQNLSRWTNMTNITVYNAWEIADTIFVEHIYGKAPDWATDDVRQNLSNINDLAFHFLYENKDAKRIRGGPVVQDMWLNMNSSVHNGTFKKVKMYSAHDTTVSAVLSFLGINYPHQPQYASALFIDLLQQNSEYFVRVEYLNVTDSNQSFPYVLDGCKEFNCPFQNFTNIYAPIFPDTADVECAKKEPPMPPSNNNSKLVTILVVVIVLLAIVIFVLFLYLYLKKNKRDQRQLINDT